MIRRFFATTTLCAILAVGLVGCGQSPPGEIGSAIHVAELPPVAGCDSMRTVSKLALQLRPVSNVDDLYLVQSGGRNVCIDSLAGVHAMLLRVDFLNAQHLAASNPMPGDPGQDETGSNPMPGDETAGSNPMPGEQHKP